APLSGLGAVPGRAGAPRSRRAVLERIHRPRAREGRRAGARSGRLAAPAERSPSEQLAEIVRCLSLLPVAAAVMMALMPPEARRVVILAYPGVQTLDVIGPAEVFQTAARLKPPAYSVEVVARERGPLASTTVGLVADRAMRSCRGPIDTLIVAGGPGAGAA